MVFQRKWHLQSRINFKLFQIIMVSILYMHEVGAAIVSGGTAGAVYVPGVTTSAIPTDNIPIPPPPQDKQYLMQDDNCGAWLKPAGQNFSLIYDYEIEYTYDSNQGDVAVWKYKEALKLPVYCLYCAKPKLQADKDLAASKGTSQADYQTSTASSFLAHMGEDFFAGSVLCLDKQASGAFVASPYFMLQLNQDSAPSRLANTLLSQIGIASNRKTQTFSASRLNPNVDISANVFSDDLMAKTFPTTYSLRSMEKTVFFQNSNLNNLMYPDFHISNIVSNLIKGYDATSASLYENCATVDPALITSFGSDSTCVGDKCNQLSPKAMAGMNTILNKGWGCVTCPPSTKIAGTVNMTQSYSYLEVPGFSSIPKLNQFKQEGIFLERRCDKDQILSNVGRVEISSGKVTGQQFFNQFVGNDTSIAPVSCDAKIENCAICTQDAVTLCKLCIDGYSMNNITDATGQTREICIPQFCPQGSRMVSNINGIRYCEPCTIANCYDCGLIKVQVEDQATYDTVTRARKPTTYTKRDIEMCTSCFGSFILNKFKTRCLSFMEYVTENQIQQKDHSLSLEYVIEARAEINPLTVKDSDIALIELKEQQNELYFLQQAFNKINDQASNYKEVNATIWLTKGNHFFFNCDKTVTYAPTTTAPDPTVTYDASPLQHDILCSLKNMRFSYPKTDNVNLQIKTMKCDSVEAKGVGKARTDLAWFYSVCATIKKKSDPWNPRETTEIDERPIMFVNSNKFYFNVTKSLYIEDVIFDGINQFSQTASSDDNSTKFQTPYTPAIQCLLDIPSGGFELEAENTRLLQLMEDSNSATSTAARLGFGYVPLKSEVSGPEWLSGTSESTAFTKSCSYEGIQHNLYTMGTSNDFNDLLARLYPHFYTFSAAQDLSAFQRSQEKSYGQDDINYASEQFNSFTTDANQASEVYGVPLNTNRRQSLFNLYAFTYQESYQKGTASAGNIQELSPNYQIPTLKLDNVDVRNFLYDYQALVYVENDNYIVRADAISPADQHVMHFGDYTAGANIVINRCSVSDSSFKKGMIYVPSIHNFINKGPGGTVFRYQDNQIAGYKTLVASQKIKAKEQSQIILNNSKFTNLNYGQVIYQLGSLNPKENEYAMNKGIVLTVKDFNGRVEVIGSKIDKNMVFIPSAIFSNSNKFNQTAFNPSLSDFTYKKNTTLSKDFGDNAFLDLVKYEPNILKHNIHFLNYIDPVSQAQVLTDKYSSMSPIYLENISGEHIIFKDNIFDSNIGIHGGALSINMESNQAQSDKQVAERVNNFTSFLYFQNNTFTRNMAYFEGNAVFIKGHQKRASTYDLISKAGYLNMLMDSSTFKYNYGLNVGIGSALSINGMQGTKYLNSVDQNAEMVANFTESNLTKIDDFQIVHKFGISREYQVNATARQLSIQNSVFSQNYAGQKGSGVNVYDVQKSNVILKNLTFTNNTGSFSMFEYEHQLPFYKYLTLTNFRMNYMPQSTQWRCMSEYAQIGQDDCFNVTYDTSDFGPESKRNPLQGHILHIQYSHMKGAVYLDNNRDVSVLESTFMFNDAGPLLENKQIVGLKENSNSIGNVQRASSIFIGESSESTTIERCTFTNNTISFLYGYFQDNNRDINKFFPPNYMFESQSPQINVYQNNPGNSTSRVMINNNTFSDQRHREILGYSTQRGAAMDTEFYASLLSIFSKNLLSEVSFSNNTVSNQIFVGSNSALITSLNYGALNASDNMFVNIGHLSDHTSNVAIPNRPLSWGRNLTYQQREDIVSYQNSGVFWLRNSAMNVNKTNRFVGNVFNNIYAFSSGVYKFDQLRLSDIREYVEGNYYSDVFAVQSGILQCMQKQVLDEASKENLNQYLNRNPQSLGLIMLKGEVVQRSHAANLNPLYDISHQLGMVNLVVSNSQIVNIKQQAVKANGAQIWFRNSRFTSDETSPFGSISATQSELLTTNGYSLTAQINNQAITFGPEILRLKSRGFSDKALKMLSIYTQASKSQHHNGTIGFVIYPTDAELQTLTDSGSFDLQYMQFSNSKNSWAPYLMLNQSFVNQTSFGNLNGLEQIFEGFEIQNLTLAASSQLINCTFETIYSEDQIKAIIDLKSGSQLLIRNSTFDNIQTLVVRKEMSTMISIQNSTLTQLGAHVLNHIASVDRKSLAPVLNATQPLKLFKGGQFTTLTTKSAYWQDLPNGFISGRGGISEVLNTTITNSLSIKGLIRATSNEHVNIDGCNFTRLVAEDQAALLFLVQNENGNVVIQNSKIEDSMSKSSLISMTFSNLIIVNSSFNGNYASTSSNGISMIYSNVEIWNSTIDNEENRIDFPEIMIKSVQAGFVNMNYQSTIKISNTTAKSLRAQTSSFLYATGSSSVEIGNQSHFFNNSGSADCISAVTPTKFTFLNSSMSLSDGIKIESTSPGAVFIVDNSTFYPYKATNSLKIISSTGLIQRSNFTRSSIIGNLEQSESAVRILGGSDVQVLSSNFTNLTSVLGAAIQISDSNKFLAADCQFYNNTAESGGAVSITQVPDSVLSGNNFTNNSAKKQDGLPVNMQADQNKLRGGGLYIDCIQSTSNPCLTTLQKNNTFAFNYAEIQGGAISYRSSDYKNDNTNTFSNNSAGVIQAGEQAFANQTVYSYANSTLQLYPYNTTTEESLGVKAKKQMDAINAYLIEQSKDQDRAGWGPIVDFIQIPSGQSVNFTIQLYAGSIHMQNENQATAKLVFRSLKDLNIEVADKRILSSSLAQPAAPTPSTPASTVGPAQTEILSNIQNNVVKCVDGTFNFADLVISLEPGNVQLLEVQFEGLDSIGVKRPEIDFPAPIVVYSRSCVSGEELTKFGTCEVCSYGFYLIEVPNAISKCKTCELNAICMGGNSLFPVQGYTKSYPYSTNIVECHNSPACLQGDTTELTGICAPGYRGFMCGSCQDNFIHNPQLDCVECGSYNTTLIQAFLRISWFVILIYGISRLNVKITATGDRQYNSFMKQIKMIINHCIVLAAISNIKYNWSEVLGAILDAQGYIIMLGSKFIDFGCLVAGRGIEDPNFYFFFKKLLFTVLFPFAMIIFMAFVLSLVSCKKGSMNAIRDQMICIMVVTLWLFHPDVCHAVFASLSCVEDDEGKPRLFSDQDIICWEGQHQSFVTWVTIPAVLVWVIGLPVFFFCVLRSNQQTIRDIAKKNATTKLEKLKIDTFQNRYGFLISGVHIEFYYWEVVVMLRKSLIIFACEFLSSISPNVQILTTMLIVIISIVSVAGLQPLENKQSNAINIFSQAVHLVWMYNGLYYVTGYRKPYMDPATGVDWVFIPFISIPSFGFFIFWLMQMKTQILVSLYNNNMTAFKTLTCGLMDEKAFYNNHVVEAGTRAEVQQKPVTAAKSPGKATAPRREAVYLEQHQDNGELNYNVSNINLDENQDVLEQKIQTMISMQLRQSMAMAQQKQQMDELKQTINQSMHISQYGGAIDANQPLSPPADSESHRFSAPAGQNGIIARRDFAAAVDYNQEMTAMQFPNAGATMQSQALSQFSDHRFDQMLQGGGQERRTKDQTRDSLRKQMKETAADYNPQRDILSQPSSELVQMNREYEAPDHQNRPEYQTNPFGSLSQDYMQHRESPSGSLSMSPAPLLKATDIERDSERQTSPLEDTRQTIQSKKVKSGILDKIKNKNKQVKAARDHQRGDKQSMQSEKFQ